MANSAGQKVLLASSEVVGFAKTGGLADVAGSLPRALSQRGLETAIILPLYSCTRKGKIPLASTGRTFSVPIGNRTVAGSLWQATLPGSTVPVYLVEQPDYFERDDPAKGSGLYQFTLPGGHKRDYPDNCERFIFFCRAVLEAMRLLDYWPDVLHLNDWQTGLVPVYLREIYRHEANYDRMRTLFSIHNIAYQGQFWHWDMLLTGLDWRLFNYQQLEFYGQLNFLKAGIVFADLIGTVSPTYAREIQTPYYGHGLEGVLAERGSGFLASSMASIILSGTQRPIRICQPPTTSILSLGASLLARPACNVALVCRKSLRRPFWAWLLVWWSRRGWN